MSTGVGVVLFLAAIVYAVDWWLRRIVVRRYAKALRINRAEAAHLADRDNWWLRTEWRERVRAAICRRR